MRDAPDCFCEQHLRYELAPSLRAIAIAIACPSQVHTLRQLRFHAARTSQRGTQHDFARGFARQTASQCIACFLFALRCLA
eukprot:15463939-Alexandrium_andersonii.AAC.1